MCSTFEVQEKLLKPKWDTLKKHGGKRKAKKAIPMKNIRKGKWYIAYNCKHLVNERKYAARSAQKPIIQQLREVKGERARKRQQLATIFLFLQQGHPMVEYEAIRSLMQFLGVPKLAQRHWSDCSGWSMAAHIYK
jgi:hypothetical protein